MSRIAVLGGAFDPPTKAHIEIAKTIVTENLADTVWITPTYHISDEVWIKSRFNKYTHIKWSPGEISSTRFRNDMKEPGIIYQHVEHLVYRSTYHHWKLKMNKI
ncbi:MAG: hypothetical protein HC831_21970 [Chloroflexia bacterium]|nr:hypothetical protein [Chloroflexia bacterium]